MTGVVGQVANLPGQISNLPHDIDFLTLNKLNSDNAMKIVCLIDCLASGGAQRQLCTLAVLLRKLGHHVGVVTYHPHDFFLPLLREGGVEYTCIGSCSLLHRVAKLRRILRRGDQDVVLAFLPGAVLYAELAAIPFRKWGLVVSERSADPSTSGPRESWLRRFHRIADYVTTNSHTTRLMIERDVPSLKNRVVTIYNTVDLETFHPTSLPSRDSGRGFRIVVAARYSMNKNPLGFIQGVALARERAPSLSIELDWYGNQTIEPDVFPAAMRLVERQGLHECVRLHGESQSILSEYQNADAVAMPSSYEGLPNTICEAMAVGRPILLSNVCDAGNLVRHGENGFLFDASSPEDVARAILDLAVLGSSDRERLGLRSRQMAERMFCPATVAERYLQLLTAAAARKRVEIEHWIPEVPESAYRFVDRG